MLAFYIEWASFMIMIIYESAYLITMQSGDLTYERLVSERGQAMIILLYVLQCIRN